MTHRTSKKTHFPDCPKTVSLPKPLHLQDKISLAANEICYLGYQHHSVRERKTVMLAGAAQNSTKSDSVAYSFQINPLIKSIFKLIVDVSNGAEYTGYW